MIQWYPGHMKKAKNKLKEDLQIVDLVLEVVDARIPASSRNPELKKILNDQDYLLVLNKMDLASKKINEDWLNRLSAEFNVLKVDSLHKKGISRLVKKIDSKAEKINNTLREKGRNERPIRIMVIGIPNVGKSALINALAGRSTARMGDKPGVTRGKQWINISKTIQLLDTPGILWPKLNDENTAYKLAITGAIEDKRFDLEMAAYKLIGFIMDQDNGILESKYGIEIETEQPYDILPLIGKKRGCLMSGGRVDRKRTAKIILQDFRNGEFGRLSLETPAMMEDTP